MAEVWIMGEMIVEIMRAEEDIPLDQPGLLRDRTQAVHRLSLLIQWLVWVTAQES